MDMRVVTDDPASAARFLGNLSTRHWDEGRDLSPFERAIIEALGGGAVWSMDVNAGDSFWRTIVVLSATRVSQFDALDRLMGNGRFRAHPTACLALEGEGFHGQRGRTWAGAAGNLHMSVAVPVDREAAQVGLGLSMLPTVAALDAIAEATAEAVRPGIKWVNDIVIGDRKLGGVLTAAHTTGCTIDDVLWGIGINVEVAPHIPATPFVSATTCVRAHRGGESATVPCVFWALLAAIARRHRELTRFGYGALLSAYRTGSVVLGRKVQVWDEAACTGEDPAEWASPWAAGTVIGIADDLSLTLAGHPTPVSKGRLALCPRL
jgi:biotin-(acetyl-CoA carboxylase) ligase